eukprot:CAMPEP_0184502436 /NCGR_PEP_ID=MMETSP0113_2-20130426/50339_1 /TAXON_ID=91329 /ORGANISM="Norrisiella sphaerica, Strain BC52" /LENGTH=181 /DNA_ID=CAMNT_0026891613 /DNA_START=403 /DNA_END=945 /DNA_ORIENTATION=+
MEAKEEPTWDQVLQNHFYLWNQTGKRISTTPHPQLHGPYCVQSVTLDDVLDDSFPSPLDLGSFARYCEKTHNDDLLAFLLLTKRLKSDIILSSGAYCRILQSISKKYVSTGAQEEINIDHKFRQATVRRVANSAKKGFFVGNELDPAIRAARAALKLGVFRSFLGKNVILGCTDTRTVAYW